MAGRGTHYERAFDLWLQTSGISYVAVDQEHIQLISATDSPK